jgi:hypothetical protein
MKKLLAIGFVIVCLRFAVGCGVQGTPTSKATPPISQDQHMQDMEAAIKSGKLDPKTYGRQ